MNRAARLLAAALLPLAAAPASAHPVDELVQAAYLTLIPSGVELQLDLTPGSEIAEVVLAALDSNGDGAASEAEASAFGRAVLMQSALTLDGSAVTWELYRVTAPPLDDLRWGAGVIRIYAQAGQPHAEGSRLLEYRNAYEPTTSQWTANVFLNPGQGRAYEVTEQQRGESGRRFAVAYVVR